MANFTDEQFDSTFNSKSSNDSKNKGVQVLGLFPHSPAALAGVQVGDIILAVDDVAVSNLKEVADRLAARQANMKLDILRGNSLKEIIVPPSMGSYDD